MKLRLLLIGKTSEAWLREGCDVYAQRIMHYLPFQQEYLPDIRNTKKMPADRLRRQEAQQVMDRLLPGDHLVLLDEKGRQMSSAAMAEWIGQHLVRGTRNLTFVIAGAYGADPMLKERADQIISLSEMTFPHQLVRVIFMEQLYRALTIWKGEKYHNE